MRKNGLEKKKTGLRLRRHSGDTKTQAGHKGIGRRERLPTDISGGLKGNWQIQRTL